MLFKERGVSLPENLLPVHQLLNADSDAGKDWKHQDIWRCYICHPIADYSIRQNLATAQQENNRNGRGWRTGSPYDLKSTWRACLTVPSEKKSFTFILRTLIPSFRRHHSSAYGLADTHEFQMAVMSEFVSGFIYILCAAKETPLSWLKWKETEGEALNLRRAKQEQEAQFRASFGGSYSAAGPLPSPPRWIFLKGKA